MEYIEYDYISLISEFFSYMNKLMSLWGQRKEVGECPKN
jgi:hypothetical protein